MVRRAQPAPSVHPQWPPNHGDPLTKEDPANPARVADPQNCEQTQWMEFKPLSCGAVCGAATGHGPSALCMDDPNLLSYSGMFQVISAHGLCPFFRNSSSPFFSCCISFWPPLRIQHGHPLFGGGSLALRVSPDGPRHTASAVTHLFLSLHVRAAQGMSLSEPLVPNVSGTRAASPAPVWTHSNCYP